MKIETLESISESLFVGVRFVSLIGVIGLAVLVWMEVARYKKATKIYPPLRPVPTPTPLKDAP